MGMFFVYIIKVTLLQTVFYLTYKLLLSRESFHAFNRGVLLAMQAAALLLPLVHVTLDSSAPVHHTIALAEAAIVQTVMPEGDGGAGLTPVQVLAMVWMGGFVLLMLRSAVSLVRLALLLRSGRRCEVCGVEVTVVGGDMPPFSWFSRIVVSEKDCAAGAREIVIHEQEHVRRLHSLDIALCNTVIMFCWFSPAAWLLRAELRDVHEYEADEAVLRRGVDASGYQLLLIRKAVGERLFAMANNLNQTNLKKRIAMMKMKKSNPWNRFRAAAVLPLAAVSVFVFATPEAVRMAGDVAQESGNAVSDAGAMMARTGTRIMSKAMAKPYDVAMNAVSADSVKQSQMVFSKSYPDDVLVVVDGRETDMDGLSHYDVSEIASMTVIKGDKGVDIYGDKAKNGVIIVSLKKCDRTSSASSGVSEKTTTTGNVNKVTAYLNGNSQIKGKIVGVKKLRINAGEKTPKTVEVYKMNGDIGYKIDGKSATKEEVEAILPDRIESVVVDKDDTSGGGTLNVFLKKDSSNE